MLFRFTAPLALVVALAGLAGCSGGGGSTGSVGASCSGTDVNALCLFNCSLGCSTTGCLRTNIAQNEILILQFSDNIDPASVSTSTIRLRTGTGELPVGQFFVNGNQVEFVPTLLVSGGQTFFGFRPGEVYTLTIPGGENEADRLRSASGFPFNKTFSCTLVASEGIQDLNGVSPSASLISPTVSQLGAAPLNTIIQIEFNEAVDVTPFLSGSPVTFEVRRTRPGLNGPECDPASSPQPLPGTPRLDFDPARGISILTFLPQQPLPPNVCVEINVTSAVVDLSGKPAQPQTFTFLTVVLPLMEQGITEEFDTDQFLDRDQSGGQWSGGVATFADIGGDGRHGSFTFSSPHPGTNPGTYLGVQGGRQTYEVNTDSTTIPAENTLTGSPIAVTDGKFFFSQMVVPGDTRVRFVGSSPPVVTVAGKIDISGEIDVQGETLPYPASTTSAIGQVGGAGGIFAGNGGNGGDKCLGNGSSPNYQGDDGESARVLAGRAYAATVGGTGGKGSVIFPASGQNSALFFAPGIVTYTPSASGGAGGAGMRNPGQQGMVVSNNHTPSAIHMGPPADGGTAVDFFPFPPSSGSTKSSLHFLVGGAGGGGAASNAALAISVARNWAAGGGGGGGGGVVALRAGDSLTVGAVGKILANGGSAGSVSSSVGATAAPAPGGGGSGGSVVLQSGRAANLAGEINVLGGSGGDYDRQAGGAPPSGARVVLAGGDASSGFVRFEMPGAPTPSMLANMQPAATSENVATLTELDEFASFRSEWYSTGLVFGPEFARYEIHATVDGVPVVFSDDPATSPVIAGPGAPLRFWIQAAQLDLTTGAVLDIRPWRTGVLTNQSQVGIASDGLNGYRFVVIQDRGIATVVTIDKIVIIYRI